jgi:hypothetical protein
MEVDHGLGAPCRVRCFCPCCHEKRALEKAGWVAEQVCAEVPHRQFVFTIPMRLRIYFRFERRLLGELCRAAARTVDFLAEVTQHIPGAGEHLIRYYGWYSNKSRGQPAPRPSPAPQATAAPTPPPPTAREARKGWAALIKQVYETDPLCCPKCGAQMKIIAFIQRRQTEVIEKILSHCGLWEEGSARGPPAAQAKAVG